MKNSYFWFGPAFGQAYQVTPCGSVTQVVAAIGYAAVIQIGYMPALSEWLPCPKEEYTSIQAKALETLGLIDQDEIYGQMIDAHEALQELTHLAFA